MTPSPTTATPSGRSTTEPTHHCVRCGRPIPLDDSMCEVCNPLGLEQPATSQAHGTVLVGIVLAVVGLALLGRLALSGVGPFTGSVTEIRPVDIGLEITLTVRNEGTSAGNSRCRIYDPTRAGAGPSAVVLSPQLAAGEEVAFTTPVRQFGTAPLPLAVECHAP